MEGKPISERRPTSLTHEAVVEAMQRLLEQRPWSDIAVRDVAHAVGVSRQTLYNEFVDRDGLALAYAQWTASRFLNDVEGIVEAHADDIEAALGAALELFIDSARSHPLVRAVEMMSGTNGVAAFVSDDIGRAVVERSAARVTDLACRTWPTLEPGGVAVGAEILVRLAISYLTVPSCTPSQAARQVTAVVLPFLRSIEQPAQAAQPARSEATRRPRQP